MGAVLTDSIVADNFKRAMKNLERASDNTVNITGSVSRFASRLNTKGSLAHELVSDTTVFRSLKRSASKFETAVSSADQSIATLSRTAENLQKASEKLNNTNSPLGVLLTDQKTANNLRTTISNLSRGTELLNEDLKAAQNNFLLRGFFKKKAKAEAKQKADSLEVVKQRADSLSAVRP